MSCTFADDKHFFLTYRLVADCPIKNTAEKKSTIGNSDVVAFLLNRSMFNGQ